MAIVPFTEGFETFPPPAAFFLDVALFVAGGASEDSESAALEAFRGEARVAADEEEGTADDLGAITKAATSYNKSEERNRNSRDALKSVKASR